MKVQLASDLHLETDPTFRLRPVDGAEVLVLAGDIGSYQKNSRLLTSDFGLSQFSPRLGGHWRKVLYLPGNHEYDSLEYETTYQLLRRVCKDLDITWLEHEVVEFQRVRFIGSTLWSDFDALSGQSGSSSKREKAIRAANHYLQKNTMLMGGVPMLAEDLRPLALASQEWLRSALGVPYDGLTVVVTHFAPSLRSADPRYGLTPGTAGFCNSLDSLVIEADYWLHGHLHCFNDYFVDGVRRNGRRAACRVIANPLGYLERGEQVGFRDNLVIQM